ncbi:MAG: hypothetical protein IJ033_02670 [Clostridia bacterium]|nr:hypothetical protein [Clostridia bacterium]
MEKSVALNGYAKVNLSLGISGVENGFHMLDSVMTTVDLYDEVTMSLRDDDQVTVTYLTGESFACDNALKTAKALKEHYALPGVDIKISKHVPQGIGVGGSAVDSAAIARGYEMLLGKQFNDDFLVTLGGDVPFLKRRGSAVVTGRGEGVTPIMQKALHIALAYGTKSISTRDVFALYDARGGENGTSKQFLSDGIPFNALEKSAIEIEPSILESKNLLFQAGFDKVVMTGAGSAFIAFESDKELFESKLKQAEMLAESTDIKLKKLTLIKE